MEVTDHHTAVDYAKSSKIYPTCISLPPRKSCWSRIIRAPIRPALLYAAFPAPEARRLANRFEWHYTPKHGSWLDMAESELAVLTTQCLSPPHLRQANPQERSCGLAEPSKQTPHQSRLAIHDRKRVVPALLNAESNKCGQRGVVCLSAPSPWRGLERLTKFTASWSFISSGSTASVLLD